MINFTNYISLGYFCEVAQDLGTLGLRSFSSPFDWGISSFPFVLQAIENGFEGFMDYDELSQSMTYRNYYHDDKYHFWFYHDFSMFIPLDKQYENVKKKYTRRINRFMKEIKKPTLFVRYISSEQLDATGQSVELEFIEQNYKYILNMLRQYNSNNDIIFIGDELINSDIIKVYHVERDKNDTVSRSPIISNKELYPVLSSIDFPNKEMNKKYFKTTMRRSLLCKLKRKTVVPLLKLFMHPYIHYRVYDDTED